jgi:mono/diheme cytochrome c family protein
MYSGAYNIGTGNHDNALINWFFDTGMTRSVQLHAMGIKAPSLTDPAMLQAGAERYRKACAGCHGIPGVLPGDIPKGLWPRAPDLARTVPTWTPEQLFWITKYGLKFTAMPAWGPSQTDSEIWEIVAYLEVLPHLANDLE